MKNIKEILDKFILQSGFDERLKYALKKVYGAEAFLYEVDFNIKEFK